MDCCGSEVGPLRTGERYFRGLCGGEQAGEKPIDCTVGTQEIVT